MDTARARGSREGKGLPTCQVCGKVEAGCAVDAQPSCQLHHLNRCTKGAHHGPQVPQAHHAFWQDLLPLRDEDHQAHVRQATHVAARVLRAHSQEVNYMMRAATHRASTTPRSTPVSRGVVVSTSHQPSTTRRGPRRSSRWSSRRPSPRRATRRRRPSQSN